MHDVEDAHPIVKSGASQVPRGTADLAAFGAPRAAWDKKSGKAPKKVWPSTGTAMAARAARVVNTVWRVK
jgi:hypothetical protein